MKARNVFLLLLLTFLGGVLPLVPAVSKLEDSSIDARFLIRGPQPFKSNVVVITIDDNTDRAWVDVPKAFWATKLAELSAHARLAGARSVGIDVIVTVDPDTFLLNKGIDESPNFDLYNEVEEAAGTVYLGTRLDPKYEPLTSLLDASRFLSANTLQGDQVKIRKLPRWDESFTPPKLTLSNGLSNRDIGRRDPIEINYSGTGPKILSGIDVLEGKVDDTVFKDAIVLIGESSFSSQDRIDTPVANLVPGVVVHAEAINTVLSATELVETSPIVEIVVGALIGLISCFAAHRCSVARYLIVTLSLCVIWIVVAYFCFNAKFVVLPIAVPILVAALLTPVCIFPVRAIEERHERLWARSQWGQMVSDEFVEVLEKQRSAGLGSMETFRAALFFLDVAGFSEKSNRLSSQAVVDGLNTLFDPIIEHITEHHGTVLNFIGDGLVAMFHGEREEAYRENALQASFSILYAVDQLAKERKDGEDWNVRIGMAVGDVNLALVGSKERKQMTVYGSAVNMAARLEQAGKSLGTRLAVSMDFAPFLEQTGRKFDQFRIKPKGWDEEVEVLALQEAGGPHQD